MKRSILLSKRAFVLSLVVFSFLVSGCATTTLFSSYTGNMKPILDNVAGRRGVDLSKALVSESKGADKILYTMERGRIGQIVDNVTSSKEDFRIAIDAIKEFDDKALISASSVASEVGGALVNDNARPYEADGYERVLVHHFQAVNYLKEGNLEGAGVEARLANREQGEALKRHEAENEKANAQAKEKKLDQSKLSGVENNFVVLDEVAGKVKNSFQNAYSFYLSGILYEATGSPNDAYIDYRKALEIFPDNKYVQDDVLRLGKKLKMDDYDAYAKEFAREAPAPPPEGSGELIVLFEDGLVVQKEEVKIPVPVQGNIVMIAFPIYKKPWKSPVPLVLTNVADNASLGSTEPIAYIDAMAVKALKEEVPGIVIRQAIRALGKAVLAKTAEEKGGVGAKLLANVWNIVSENADIRSWITLPSNAQILRTTVPSGKVTLRFDQPGVSTLDADVEVPAKGRLVLHVIRAGGGLQYSVIPVGANDGAALAAGL